MRRGLITPVLLRGRAGYTRKVLSLAPIACWPLNETGGTTAVELVSGNHGAYTGVDLANAAAPGGGSAPYFDGANDYVDIYTTGLRDSFNGAAGSLVIWVRANVAWSDNNAKMFCILHTDNNNYLLMDKASANTLLYYYKAGGTVKSINRAATSPTGWFLTAQTWSTAADEFIAYYNGAQTGSTATGLGTWAGSLANTQTLIGANSRTPNFVWDGWLAHCALWDRVLSAAEIASLYAWGLD